MRGFRFFAVVVIYTFFSPAFAYERIDTVQILEGPTDLINSSVFSPDGELIYANASLFSNEGIWIWETATGEVLQQFASGRFITDVVMSPDSQRIAIELPLDIESDNGEAQISLWDPFLGEPLLQIATVERGFFQNQFSTDGNLLIRGGSFFDLSDSDEGTSTSNLRVWDSAIGELVFERHFENRLIFGTHSSPDSSLILAFGNEGVLALDSSNGETLREYLRPNIRGAQFDSSQTRIIGFSSDEEGNGEVFIWNFEDDQALDPVVTVQESFAIEGVQFHPSEPLFIINPRSPGPVQLRSTQTGEVIHTLLETDDTPVRSTCAKFVADGEFILSFYKGKPSIWRTSTLEKVYELPRQGYEEKECVLDVTSDGRFAVGHDTSTQNPTLQLIDLQGENRERTNTVQILEGPTDYPKTIGMSPNGQWIYATSIDRIWIWDTETGSVRHHFQTEGLEMRYGNAVASPNSRLIAVHAQSDTNQTVKIWNTDDGTHQIDLPILDSMNPEPEFSSLRFSADGVLLFYFETFINNDSENYHFLLKAWNVASGESVFTRVFENREIFKIEPTRDHSILLAIGFQETLVLRTGDGDVIREYSGEEVWDAHLNPDQTRIAIASNPDEDGGEISIWDFEDEGALRPLFTVREDFEIQGVKFHPNGEHFIVSPIFNNRVNLRNAQTGDLVSTLTEENNDFVQSSCAKYVANGEMILSSYLGKATLWDVLTGEKIHELPKHGFYEPNCGTEVTPNGRFALTFSYSLDGLLRLIRLDNPESESRDRVTTNKFP